VAKEIDTLARNTIKEELKSIDPMMMSGGSGVGNGKNSIISNGSNSTTINGSEIWDGAWAAN
jgi:hypothetical protein